MGFIESAEMAIDPGFTTRVKMAVVTAAAQIAAEAWSARYAYMKRHKYAVAILNEPNARVHSFSLAVASNPVITMDSTDSDIQFTVNSLFDSMAGVTQYDRDTDDPQWVVTP